MHGHRLKNAVLLAAGLLLLFGCMTERIPPPAEHPGIGNQATFLVKKIEYDVHGRPLFDDRLNSRPGSAGDVFTFVQTINGFPSRSFDIAVVEEPHAGPGPLAVIYTWTGKGFEGGVQMAEGISPQGTISSGAEAAAYIAIKTAPVVIATAAGFVVGVLASVPAAARELQQVIAGPHETVTGITEFSYDNRGRIRFMKLYPPEEHAAALVKTQFFYAGEGKDPVRTEVTNFVDHSVRHIPED